MISAERVAEPSPYRAGLAEPSLQRLPTGSASTACFCPVGLSSAGKPLTQGSVAPNTLLICEVTPIARGDLDDVGACQ